MNLFKLAPFATLSLFACAATPPPPAATPTSEASTTAADAPSRAPATEPVACDLVCERALVQRRANDDPDYHAQATEDANRVLASMHPDLLACYKKRVAVNPNAHGVVTVDIVIGPDGHVMRVETTGGAIIGKQTTDCMVRRIEKATFAPPHDGGTMRIHVPFSLRRVTPDEDA